MIRFAARRFAAALITAWVASIIAFVLFWTVPNVDPSYFLGGAEHGTNESRARATEKYGLDDPLPVQYVRLMKSILNGDIECFYTCGSLREVFFEALPVTISLVAGAALIAVGLGVWLALIAVRHRGRWQDRLITTAATAAYSVPSLVLAALLPLGVGPTGGLCRIEGQPVGMGEAPVPPLDRVGAAVRGRLRAHRARVAARRG